MSSLTAHSLVKSNSPRTCSSVKGRPTRVRLTGVAGIAAVPFANLTIDPFPGGRDSERPVGVGGATGDEISAFATSGARPIGVAAARFSGGACGLLDGNGLRSVLGAPLGG